MQDWILNVCFTHTIAPRGYDLLRKAHFKNHLELQAHPPGQNACKDLPLFQEKCSVSESHTHTLTRFPGFKLQAQLSLRCIKIFWALTWYLLKKPRVILGFEKKYNSGERKKKSHQSKHISSWILRSVFQRTFVKASKRPALAKTKQSLALLFLRMLYIELQGYYDANLKCTSFLLGHKHKTVYIVLSEEKVCC